MPVTSSHSSPKTVRSAAALGFCLILSGLAFCLVEGCATQPAGSSAAGVPPNARRSAGKPPTALDLYVAAPDTNFAWSVFSTKHVDNYTVSVLQMTSQIYLTTNEVDQPVWKHWLTIIRPDDVKTSTALLFITGGSTRPTPPGKPDENIIHAAVESHSVVAELRNVPNEPLLFKGEPETRTEDAMIAYTWDKFLRTGDAKWPARLPMTKSAVRGMDTVTAFCATKDGGSIPVNHFVVAGGSKRGWTTWTTGAVDNRVVAIVPIVIDMLNIVPSFIHHWKAYGFWAPAVGNYTEMKIMDWTGTKEYEALMKIEEPYEYRDRLTMPKFIVNACGDQFFLPDSSQFYFTNLPGVKYLRYVPNTDHSLKGSDAWQTLITCHDAIVKGAALPRFSWVREGDSTIRVKATDRPTEVKLWQATNPKARDFRLEAVGKIWTSTTLTDEGGGVYVGKVGKPEKGYTAFMVELTFPSTAPYPFKFTTDVVVNPDTLPFPYVQPPHP